MICWLGVGFGGMGGGGRRGLNHFAGIRLASLYPSADVL